MRELEKRGAREERAPGDAVMAQKRRGGRVARGGEERRDGVRAPGKSSQGIRARAGEQRRLAVASQRRDSSASRRELARPTSHHIPASNTTNACAFVP